MYDLFFISYDEPNADDNWALLSRIAPAAKRIHGVKGIREAHLACAEVAQTSNFWVVDADNEVIDRDFTLRLAAWDRDYVHVWHARNPVNGLQYGWGGVKLFPRRAILTLAEMPLDMTTSLPLKVVPKVKSVTRFNTSPFETWRAAFRECAKLTMGRDDPETAQRLSTWMTTAAGFHADECLDGAHAGHAFALETPEAIARINDYDWLRERFEAR